MAENTVGWFGVREKYYSLADKPWLISQMRASQIGARLPGWKEKFLSSSGKEILVKTVLSSLPIYHLTAFHAQMAYKEN